MPSVTPGYTFTGTTDPITYTKLNLLAQPTVAAIAAGEVTTSMLADGAVTLTKIVDAAANNTFLARSTSGIGDYEALVTTTTGLGFYTGAGGEVIQGNTSGKGTAFTLDKMCGEITHDGAVLNAATIVSATWNNSLIAATDVVIINHKSGGTMGSYTINVACGAGTATLSIRNNTASNLTDTLVLNFVVIKGVKT
jgi:hypothetical protein